MLKKKNLKKRHKIKNEDSFSFNPYTIVVEVSFRLLWKVQQKLKKKTKYKKIRPKF